MNYSLELRDELRELDNILSNISLEDIPSKGFYILEPFKRLFKFLDNINIKLFNMLHEDKFEQLDNIKRLYKGINKVIDKNNYLEIRDISVPVVTGLDIELLRAMNYIYKDSRAIDPELYNTVKDTNELMNLAITDSDFMKSFTPYKSYTDGAVKSIKRVETTIHHIVNTQGTDDRKRIGELLGNLSSLKEVINVSIKIGGYLNMSNLKGLNKDVESIYEKIELFNNEILGNSKEINKGKLKSIIDNIDVTARYITVYTSLIYVYTRLLNTIEHIYEVLDDKKLTKMAITSGKLGSEVK